MSSYIAERLESAARDLKHDRPSTASMCAEAAAEITRLRTFITALEDGNMTFLCDELDKAKAENASLRSLVEEAGKVVEETLTFYDRVAAPHHRGEPDILDALSALLDKMKEG